MAIGVEIDRPSVANQARGLKTLQGLSRRIAYLAYSEHREHAVLLDSDGQELSQQEALALLGGEDRPYQEVVFGLSANDLQALQERWPELDREECLMRFGSHLARAHGQGREVLTALHVQQDGSAHYHMETVDPYFKTDRNGEPLVDRDGTPRLEKMEGMGAHLDRAYQEAWARTMPVRRRPRGDELEALRERQATALAEQKSLAEERRATKAQMDAELRPWNEKLAALRASNAAYSERVESELAASEIKAKYADQFRELWRREAAIELERDLLWLEGRGYSRDSLEAECKRERAEMRLTARLNRIDRDDERFEDLKLSRDRYADRDKDLTTEERRAARGAFFDRETEAIHRRFSGQRADLLASGESLSAEHLQENLEVLLEREEQGIQAARLRVEAGDLRDQQDDLVERFQGRSERDALRTEREQAMADLAQRLEVLPEDEREALRRTETTRIGKEFGDRREALLRSTWEERQAHFREAQEILAARHLIEREAAALDAQSRGRSVTSAQSERMAQRHARDAARLESVMLQERAALLRLDEQSIYRDAVGADAMEALRAERDAAIEAAKIEVEALPEVEQRRALAKREAEIRDEFRLRERATYEALPDLDLLREAVESRIALEAEAERLRAFARGAEPEPKEDRSTLARAEARRAMWDLRLDQADQMDIARDRAWRDGRDARAEAQSSRVEAAKEVAKEGWLQVATSGAPEVAEKIQSRLGREVEAAERRAIAAERLQAQRDEHRHLIETASERRAALYKALEIQSRRQAWDLKLRQAEVSRNGGEWTDEHQARAEAEYEAEDRRVAATWFQQEATLARSEYALALAEATHRGEVLGTEARLSEDRAALYEAASEGLSGLTGAAREVALRDLRVREAALEARAAAEARELRAERPDWEALATSLGRAQGLEIQGAADQSREEDEYERLSDIRRRHAEQARELTAARHRWDALAARDRADLAMEPAREARREREQALLAREQAVLQQRLGEREAEAALREARRASREAEWGELKATRQSRVEGLAAALVALAEAHALEEAALKVAPQREGQEPLEVRQASMAARHEIERNAVQIEALREDERLGQRSIEFGTWRERAHGFQSALEAMHTRHGLEVASLERRLDLQGHAADAPERVQARAEMADRHKEDRERLQNSVGRLQRGSRRTARIPGKGMALAAIRAGLDKLREGLDKSDQRGGNAEVRRVHGGMASAVVTVVQTVAKHAMTVGQEAARQAALQGQHVVRAAMHTAKSAALAVVNPLAGAKALGQGLGEATRDSLVDLGKGAKKVTVGVAKDTARGAKDASKQVLGGLVDLSVPGGTEAKTAFRLAKQAMTTSKEVAVQAMAAVRSAVSLNLLGVAKAGLSAGTSVARGGIGAVKELGVGITKKLPTPIDKALSALSAVPIIGLGVKAAKLGAELAHGAAELDR